VATRNLKEVGGKLPTRGTRISYKARNVEWGCNSNRSSYCRRCFL